jgi:hypothetical protein
MDIKTALQIQDVQEARSKIDGRLTQLPEDREVKEFLRRKLVEMKIE